MSIVYMGIMTIIIYFILISIILFANYKLNKMIDEKLEIIQKEKKNDKEFIS